MSTQTRQREDCDTITNAIKSANDIEIDSMWAILKYKDIGILRKIKCMCGVLNIQSNNTLDQMPKDDNGRFLDRPTRNLIHQSLIERGRNEKTK